MTRSRAALRASAPASAAGASSARAVSVSRAPRDGARIAAIRIALASVSAIAANPSHAIGALARPATIMTIAIATHGIVSGNCKSGEVSAPG